jgi:peptidoglycan/xylan/chitin deacetylase (PgdA/CDA1 family)
MLKTFAAAILALAAASAITPALAESCRPEALGTARVLAVDALTDPRVGRKHFARTLPLRPKEVVLTFDDGPWPGTTDKVLEALRRECVRATFFLLGRNAAAHPALARAILAQGHTIGTHSYSHPLLSHLPEQRAIAEVERGIAAIGQAIGQKPAPFFRFPGFASNARLLDAMASRGIVVFGADLWASDWNPMTPNGELQLVLGRVKAAGGGIVLFHDTKTQTAAALPAFLRALKARGFSIVHVVPSRGALGAARRARRGRAGRGESEKGEVRRGCG